MHFATPIKGIHTIAALLPAVVMLVLAVLVNADHYEKERAQRVAGHARLAAASVDLTLSKLLEINAFCATSPALIDRIDFESVEENCGRYTSKTGAWLVVVELGDTHRQILNTRPDAPETLPVYPRQREQPPLLRLEERSRVSLEPGIADVFTGIVLPEGIVSAGQYVRLADGRDAMVYVSIPARALSAQLAELTVPGGPIFGLIDPTQRVVARSAGIERAMFAKAPDWIIGFMESGVAGASLGVPGPDVIEGSWDVGYQPLEMAPGWMAAAFQPTPTGARLWAPLSLPSGVTLVGFLMSGLALLALSSRDKAARKVTAAREAKAEAERQNQEKSRLLASFAHDIRSPLISLIGSLEMVEDGPSRAVDHIQLARGAAEALLQLIDDILELSFLGSGELTLHPSPVDLGQLTATLSEQVRQSAGRKGLEFRLEQDPGLPPVIEGDRLRLQQVLTNLLMNAVKYTEKGTVTLRIEHTGTADGRVTLDMSVIDTGIGLKPEDIPRIMREFGRLERAAERREVGSGLGLAIVQRILHGMGTELEVESVPGQGSRFHFRLNVPIATGRPVPDTTLPLSGIQILYAEDEPVIRRVTVRRLEEAGAQVVSALNGEDALRQLANIAPDLLLIDLQMPGIDGVELIRRLPDVSPDRAYPVFVLTSHISGPQAAEARAIGADAVFTKPIQVAALAAAFQARRGNEGNSTPGLGTNAPDSADEALLDLNIFHEMTSIMGLSQSDQLVTEFEERVKADLADLAAAINAGNMSMAGQIAHRALGLCLAMGTDSLAKRLRRIEEAAVAGEPETSRRILSGIEATLTSTLEEMRSGLGRLA